MAHLDGGMACCAVDEITCLANDETPQKSMKSLFTRLRYAGKNAANTISAFYIFTGIIKFDRKNENEDDRDGRLTYPNPVDNRTDYAQAFASLIKKAKLGRVSTLPAEWNRVNHPDHKVKVYLWRPDPVRLIEWLRENK